MRDLAVEMLRQGNEPVMIVPTPNLSCKWVTETVDGVAVLRVAVPKTRDVGYVRRTMLEFTLPFLVLHGLRKSPFAKTAWDLIAWYSPPIFFGPLVWCLKRSNKCRTYLILRDIFPEWAVDLGLMRKGITYALFKVVANLQYAVADTIGVQTESTLVYMAAWNERRCKHLEVLHNWQTPVPNTGSSIDIASTSLAGRKIVVYIGNMGIAQGMDVLVQLAEFMATREDIGFIFVGRGSEVPRLKASVASRRIDNVLFFDEVDSREMPGLLAQCFIGLVALDPRHKTHNIPGKFLTYLLAGLPVLARVNRGTDLMNLINEERVGRAFYSESMTPLREFIEQMINQPEQYRAMATRGRLLSARMFSSTTAAKQIVDSTFGK